MRRGRHPYLSATYINGYVKDQPLRNCTKSEVHTQIEKMWNTMGRKALKHNTYEVSQGNPSIQGRWHDNLWSKYPKHEIEKRRPKPEFKLDFYPDKPAPRKVMKKHDLSHVVSKKYPIHHHKA